METLKNKYGKFFSELASFSHAAAKIDETNVYEKANLQTRKFMEPLITDNALPGSGLGNIENFKAFYDAVTKEKKRGLILMEHYSNLDLPEICHFLEHSETDWGRDFSDRIVAVAGMKLNEASPYVRAFAEGFTRVVIYPTRSLQKFTDEQISDAEKEAEEKRARAINFAAMKAVMDCSKDGQMILVFPSGTRYRPGVPETKRGLPEIDSYLRIFDVMLLVSINGCCLRINPENPDNMLEDHIVADKIILTASEVIDCKSFRKKVLDSLPADCENPKQKTIDAVMQILETQHDEVEKTRL